MAFEIEFAESVVDQLRALKAVERSRLLDAIERQLGDEPLLESRNRKPLRPNPIAPWELRVGPLRVFYEVSAAAPRVVRVLAVGKKDRAVLRIAGREIKL